MVRKEAGNTHMLMLHWVMSIVIGFLLSASVAPAQETTMVPVTVDGQTVRLEMRIYRPSAVGPAPTLVFNHGSTGTGLDPKRFTRPIDFPAISQSFVQRGWVVVIPARRGRGASEGEYDEGFETSRAPGWACDPSRAIPADRALRDIEAALTAILSMPFMDRDRVVIGGQSRGGVLSVAYAGRHPEQLKGVINFVGGWSGGRCATDVNQTLFVRGARYPMETLWLYGEDDPFYSLSHSRSNFAAFQAAGGTGTFHEYEPPPGSDGHRVVDFPALWAPTVEAYLRRQGLGGPQ